MIKSFGLILLVIGVLLLVMAIQASDSVNSEISRLITGSPNDTTIWYLITGVAAVMVGATLTFIPQGH